MTARGAIVARLTASRCRVTTVTAPGSLACWPVLFGVALPPAGLATGALVPTEPRVRAGRPLLAGAGRPGELTARQPGAGTVLLDSIGGAVPGLGGWCIGAAAVVVRAVGPLPEPLPTPAVVEDFCRRLAVLLASDVATQADATESTTRPAWVDRSPVGRPAPDTAVGRFVAGPAHRVLLQLVPDRAVRLADAREEMRRLHGLVLVPTGHDDAQPGPGRRVSEPSTAALAVASVASARLAGPGADGTIFEFGRPLLDAAGNPVAELVGRCEITSLRPASGAGA
jgi:hypothetical protein